MHILRQLSLVLAGVLIGVLGSWQYQTLQSASPALERLPPPKAQPPTPPQPAAPPGPPAPTQTEINQIARENAELNAELVAARALLAEHEITLTQTRESLEELRRPMTADILSSALRAELKSGEAVVTGGYPLPDGTRLYAFVRPVVETQDNGETIIRIDSLFRAMSDESSTAVGLDNLATNAANTLQHGEVWIADELDSVLGALDAMPDTDGISMPDIAVRPGSSATIEIGDLRLKVTPTLADDGETLDFEVRLEQPQPAPAAPPAAETNTPESPDSDT